MTLAVTELTLSHFRSHRQVRLVFDGRPVAIFGPNGAGKTNLIEALSLLSPGRGLRGAAAGDLGRRPEDIGWRIGAVLTADAQRHEIDLRATPGSARACRIDGKPAPQTALGRLARLVWLVPAMDRLWLEGAEGRRRFIDRITLSFHPEHAEVSLAYDRAMRDRNRLLREQVEDARWYAALEARMARAGAVILENRAAALDRLARAQDGAKTAFPAAALALTGPEGAMAALSERSGPGSAAFVQDIPVANGDRAPMSAANEAGGIPPVTSANAGADVAEFDQDARRVSETRFAADVTGAAAPEKGRWDGIEVALVRALADSRSADLRAGRTLVGPHRADLSARYVAKDMPAGQCSTGEQKALLISLILANARAIAAQTGAPPILLLDEVAAHLDAERREALYDEICALGAQAFLTGTGPELFTAFGRRAQLLSVREAPDGSVATVAECSG